MVFSGLAAQIGFVWHLKILLWDLQAQTSNKTVGKHFIDSLFMIINYTIQVYKYILFLHLDYLLFLDFV